MQFNYQKYKYFIYCSVLTTNWFWNANMHFTLQNRFHKNYEDEIFTSFKVIPKISQMTKSRRRRWRRKSKTNLDGDPRRRDPPLIHNHYDLKMRSVGYRFSWWCEGGPLSYDRKKFWGVSGSLYQIFIVVRLNESIMKTLMGIFLISVILVQTKQGKSHV